MTYHVRRYHKSGEQKAVEAIFRGIWWLVSLPFRLIFSKKSAKTFVSQVSPDQGFVKTKWQEIEELMRLGKPSNNSRAVLEADKLLDHILKSYRVPGLTMGDRLKASRKRFSPEAYDAAWKAHKVRNEIVHNAEFELMDYSAKAAIANYKRAIGELT